MHAGMVLAKGKHMNIEKTDEKKPPAKVAAGGEDDSMAYLEATERLAVSLAKRYDARARMRRDGLDKLQALRAVVAKLPPEQSQAAEAIELLADVLSGILKTP